MTMEAHVKEVYQNMDKNKIIILNCPHCKSVLVRMDGSFWCSECDVNWSIKLNL